MACVDNIIKNNEESEMEEGEIVDELDDLSDISSEEEFLLRQRLEVLENYNNVLERKKAKRSFMGPGNKQKRDIICNLSKVSATEKVGDVHTHGTHKHLKVKRHANPYNKEKRRKGVVYVDENNVRRKRDSQKKNNSRKKKLDIKVINETSSDESEDEYRYKRKKLADAVIVHSGVDKSSLSARLHKMIHWSEAHIHPDNVKGTDAIDPNNHVNLIEALSPISSVYADDPINVDVTDTVLKDKNTICDSIEVSSDDDVKMIADVEKETITEVRIEKNANELREQKQVEKDSDDDLELLRQHALKSKLSKPQALEPNKTEQKSLSAEEDSDTLSDTELRLICLKSTFLKKAIEMKQKQKLQKKLSQSSNLEDDLLNDNLMLSIKEDGNNTDIESVDMDMGSDAEEKIRNRDGENEKKNNSELQDSKKNNDLVNCAVNNVNSTAKDDELDDDEDLLRAKLLTSLSKNLANLVNPEVLKTIDEIKNENSTPPTTTKTSNGPESKKFIIKLDESDSEGEHEATKNLTKMHIKLSEQIDFQQKLDQFLKSTRMEVEKSKLPDVVQEPPTPKKANKFVAKAVNHLPKSEQIEYKNLVRRMAELEKMKQTRQATLSLIKQQQQSKDMLKPRNVTIDTQAIINNNLEEEVAKSRKTIAAESAKMLKLKDEATKLSQRYKIAATELRNISTAITLNKKQQRAVQISLSKSRLQHQSLLKSSTTSLHSKINGRIPHLGQMSNKTLSNKLQKESNPKEEYKNPVVQKAVKISVLNDLVEETTINNQILSIQLDVTSNKKVVKISNSEADIDRIKTKDNEKETHEIKEQNKRLCGNDNDENYVKEKEEELTNYAELVAVCDHGNKRYYVSVDDYKSPLDALGSTTWQADPNAILCPFEVSGQCKDPDCKYLHTPTPTQ